MNGVRSKRPKGVPARQYSIRMSSEEKAMLDALAEHYGINASSVIRMLMKEKERAMLMEAERELLAGGKGIPVQDPSRLGVITGNVNPQPRGAS